MSEPATEHKDQPKSALDERDTLLSVAAHEIRTPLASLRLYLDAVIKAADRGSLDPVDVAVRLRKARRQCDRLNVLLNNLMDVSRAPSRPLSVTLEPVDIVATAVGVCERLRDQFTHQGRKLEVATPPGPLWGDWDRIRLEQILTNLISNAHKHAPGALVCVDVKAIDGNLVELSVSDQGPGIRAEDRHRIFERFAQAHPTEGGMGLGLWIVAQIVEAFGGTVRLTSAPGGGATFTVALPRGQGQGDGDLG
jgi:signal transduction histidine kinase